MTFNKVYQTLMDKKLRSIRLGSKAPEVLDAYFRRTGVLLREAQLWRAARKTFHIPKAGDLLWRLIHDKVRTGERLDFIDERLQKCPLHQNDLSISHIWLGCSVAKEIWAEAKLIWSRLGSEVQFLVPRNRYELAAFLAIPARDTTKAERSRWRTIYQVACWTIWKAYLSFS